MPSDVIDPAADVVEPQDVVSQTVAEFTLAARGGQMLKIGGSFPVALVGAFGEILADSGAVNYVGIEVEHKAYGPLLVRVQRIEGKTPERIAAEASMELLSYHTPRPIADWHEDVGPLLWWTFPHGEPPYVGSPDDSDWPGYHSWWTPCPNPLFPEELRNAAIEASNG
jgi:hypothetical protein